MSVATLNVVCTDGKGQRDDDRIKTKIRLMVREYLEKENAEGNWRFDLFKKTGAGGNSNFKYVRFNHNPNYFIFYVRPFSRDSGWNIRLHPPSEEVYKQFAKKLGAGDLQPWVDVLNKRNQENVVKPHNFVNGQLAKAVISGHGPHGLNVTIGENTPGHIPLQDFSPTYNRKDMLLYPTGKSLRVSICDASARSVVCSIHTDGIAETSHTNDLFSGMPEKNGFLSMVGFIKSEQRQKLALSFIAEVAVKYHPNGAPYSAVTENLRNKLLLEYGATEIDRRGIGGLILALCDDKGGDTDALMKKSNDKVFITRFGWNELKGAGYNFDVKLEDPVPVVMTVDAEDQENSLSEEEDQVSPGNSPSHGEDQPEDQVSSGDPQRGCHRPLNIPADRTPATINEFGDDGNIAAGNPELVKPETKIDIGFVKDLVEKVDNVEIADVTAYIAACSRAAEIDTLSKALAEETKRLMEWMKENKHLHQPAMRLFNFLKQESA